MMKTENAFDQVRERAVTDVVQQRGGQYGGAFFFADVIFRLKLIKNTMGQMKRAEAVGKARMLRALVSKKADAELTDAAQALKLGRIDQTDEQLPAGGIGSEANYVMDRIPVYFFDDGGCS